MSFQNGLLFFQTEDYQSMLERFYELEGFVYYSKRSNATYISIYGKTTSE